VLAVRATKATARGALLAMLVYLRGLGIVAVNKGVTGKGGRLQRRRKGGRLMGEVRVLREGAAHPKSSPCPDSVLLP
jgi:hypothetical protein